MNISPVKVTSCALVCALLSACGGGGSGGSATVTAVEASPVAGGWGGTSTSGNTVQAIILETGRMWAVAGVVSNGTLFVGGINTATFQTNGGAITSSDLRAYNFAPVSFLTGSVAGTFVAGTSITATATANGGLATSVLTLAPAPLTAYDYNAAATLSAIQGNWPGNFTNSAGTLAVNANGTYSSTTSLGCNISGLISPRASGKNVYDVTVNFGAAPCGVPNGSGTGIGIIANLTGGARQLTLMINSADLANAGVFIGHR